MVNIIKGSIKNYDVLNSLGDKAGFQDAVPKVKTRSIVTLVNEMQDLGIGATTTQDQNFRRYVTFCSQSEHTRLKRHTKLFAEFCRAVEIEVCRVSVALPAKKPVPVLSDMYPSRNGLLNKEPTPFGNIA